MNVYNKCVGNIKEADSLASTMTLLSGVNKNVYVTSKCVSEFIFNHGWSRFTAYAEQLFISKETRLWGIQIVFLNEWAIVTLKINEEDERGFDTIEVEVRNFRLSLKRDDAIDRFSNLLSDCYSYANNETDTIRFASDKVPDYPGAYSQYEFMKAILA